MANNQIQPIFILPENTQRTQGRNAQRNNIQAAKLVAETVRTTLGPKGMDKMLVDSLGDVVITNDGVTILEEMSIEHPAAKMMVEVAKAQNEAVGDGTTTAVVFAGELLKKGDGIVPLVSQYLPYAALNTNIKNLEWVKQAQQRNLIVDTSDLSA